MNNIIQLINLPSKKTKYLYIFFFWAFLTFFSVYFLPPVIGVFVSVFLAIYTYTTKNDVVTLLLFAIIGLGLGGTLWVNQLPRTSIGFGFSLNMLDFMIIAISIKLITKNVIKKAIFSKFIILFFIYLFVNYIYTIFSFGLNLNIAMNLFRVFFYYILYFYAIYAIKDLSDIDFIFKVLIVFLFIIFSLQLVQFFFKINLHTYLAKSTIGKISKYQTSYGAYGAYKTNAVRAILGDVLSPYLLFILSLGFINNTTNKKLNHMFNIAIIIFIISIFLSATRVWVTITLITLLGFFRFRKNIRRGLKILILIVIVFFIVFILIGGQSTLFVHDIFMRIGGIINIASGHIEKVGTAMSRLQQLQRMRMFISKRLLFGYGFSKITQQEMNSNFGFFNTLLVFGLLGLFIILYLIFTYISKARYYSSNISAINPYYKIIKVFLYAWYAIILAYTFTLDFFTLSVRSVIFMSLFLALSEFFFKEALKYEKNVIRKKLTD